MTQPLEHAEHAKLDIPVSSLDTVDYYVGRLRRYTDAEGAPVAALITSCFAGIVESLISASVWDTPEVTVKRLQLAVEALHKVEAL